MAENSTREKALQAALELFGRKGYDGVSMNDIAEAVGIKAPSLYKHFPSKDALFAAVAPAAGEHYHALWDGAAAGLRRLEREVQTLNLLKPERLEEETTAWFREELAQGGGFRAFVGQGGDRARWLWDGPLALYEAFFARLIELQAMKRGDAHVMAVQYLSPLLQLISLADADPSRQGTVLEEARRHIRQFYRAFAVRERPAGGIGRGLFRR